MSKVSVIGAGLSGSLLSIYLAKRGFTVSVYEARGDMRREKVTAGRSINMALSNRGIAALREVGMDQYMLDAAIPMHGRMIHAVDGSVKMLPYSGRTGEYINSISRGGLNVALIDAAEKYSNVEFHFNTPCISYDAESGIANFADGHSTNGEVVIATDGAGSIIRREMEKQVSGFKSSSVFLEHGYKELHLPFRLIERFDREQPDPFLIEKNALHIWPRNKFMMIALPNIDGSFTCTLFLAHNSDSETSFADLTTSAAVEEFFGREFPDASAMMSSLVYDFFKNPTGDLGTVKCFPWNIGGKLLLLGDAAHAVVPFYGQGMNCAFEDVRILDELIAGSLQNTSINAIDWQPIFERYGELRKVNTDAIADMAEENFYEMRDHVADPVFQRKRALETKLEQNYPAYFSKYSMVTFREDLPYSQAKQRGNAQDIFLMEICRQVNDIDELSLDELIARLDASLES